MIAGVRRIERDTSRVGQQIGPGHGRRYPVEATIHGHAHTIDCRANMLLEPTRPDPAYCAGSSGTALSAR